MSRVFLSHQRNLLLFGSVLILTLSGLGWFLYATRPVQAQSLLEEATPTGLLSSVDRILYFNIPVSFRELATMTALTVEGESIFGGPVTFQNETVFDGQITLLSDLVAEGINLNIGSGEITASNVVYTVTAGSGIEVSEGQNPVITNTDRGSSQNIFKQIKVGDEVIEADENNDELEFAAGTNISLDRDGDKITVNSSIELAWVVSGSNAVLATNVTRAGVGTSTPTNTLEINSGSSGSSGVTFTQLTSSSTAGVGGGKVLSVDSGGRIILVEDQTGEIPDAEEVLPSATSGMTLYFNGLEWVASDNLYHDGGMVGISTNTPDGRVHIMANAASTVGLVVQASDSQSANLQEWRDDNGSILSYIDANGVFNGEASFSGDFEGNVNLGLTSGTLVFQGSSNLTGDTSNLFWDNSTKRLGIGTNAPTQKLTISGGNIQLDNNTSVRSKLLNGNEVQILSYSSSQQTVVGANHEIILGGDIRLRTSTTTRLYVSPNGNIGVGTAETQPTSRLLISNTSAQSGNALVAFNETGGKDIFTASASGTPRFTIRNDGGVGVGTTTPSEELVVGDDLGNTSSGKTALVGSTASNSNLVVGQALSNNRFGGLRWNYNATAANATLDIGTFGANNLNLLTNNTARVTISSGGLVGIGTTSPGAKLAVGAGNVLVDNNQGYQGRDTGGTPVSLLSISTANNVGISTPTIGGSIQMSVPNASGIVQFLTNGSEKMRITNAGNVGIGDASPASLLTVGLDDLFQINSSGNIVSIGGVAHTIQDSGGSLAFTTPSSSILLNPGGSTTELSVATGTISAQAQLRVIGQADTQQLVVRANGTQTANLTEWQNSAGTVLNAMDANGNLYLGGVATSFDPRFYVNKSYTATSGTNVLFRAIATPANTASSTAGYYGFLGGVNIPNTHSSDISGLVLGMFPSVDIDGSGTLSLIQTLTAQAVVRGTKNVTTLTGITSRTDLSGSGTIGTSYLFRGLTPTNSGGASITTHTGLYLDNQNVATNNFAIVTNAGNIVFNEGGDANTDLRVEGDTDSNLLFVDASTDRIGIGTNAPGSKLQVTQTYSAALPADYTHVLHSLVLNTTAQTFDITGLTSMASIAVQTPGYSAIRAAATSISTSDTISRLSGLRTGNGGSSNVGVANCTTGTCNVTNVHSLLLNQSTRAPAGTTLNITNEYGALVEGPNSFDYGGTVNITNRYGLRINDLGTSGLTVGSNYGLYLENQNGASTNNFAIVTNAGNIVFNEGGDANTDFRVEGDSDANLLFVDASADRVGIGTATPTQALEIVRSQNAATVGRVANADTGNLAVAAWQVASNSVQGGFAATGSNYAVNHLANRIFVTSETGNGIAFAAVDPNGMIQMYTGGYGTSNERFTIASNGNVGVGATNPGYRFDVRTDQAASFSAFFVNDGNSEDRNGIRIQAGADDGSGTTSYVEALDGDGDVVGRLQNSSGTFGVFDVSDARTKTNIADTALGGLSVINGLRVVDFNRVSNPDGMRITGFIAQEVQQIFPNMVAEGSDGLLSINKDALIPILTKAVQEQQLQITALGSLGELELATQKNARDIAELRTLIETGQTWGASNSAEIAGIARWGNGVWYGLARAIFERPVELLASLRVNGSAWFGGRVVYADSDRAGFAVVPVGADQVKVHFETPYAEKPVITIVPESFTGEFTLESVSTDGFVIRIANQASQEITFHWTALAIENAQTTRGEQDGSEEQQSAEETEQDSPQVDSFPSPSPEASISGESADNASESGTLE